MADKKYSFQDYDSEKMARAFGSDLSISSKHSIEICNEIRKTNIQKAKEFLNQVSTLKKPVKYRRFTGGMAHKPGIGPGRYPVKASLEILKMLESAEKNAQTKGLNTSNMIIRHLSVQQSSRPVHGGSRRGRLMKRTHLEIVLEESSASPKREKKHPVKKEEVKEETATEPKLSKAQSGPISAEQKSGEKTIAEEKKAQPEEKKTATEEKKTESNIAADSPEKKKEEIKEEKTEKEAPKKSQSAQQEESQ
ncbi:50S ribosomal protein L22 [Nanoarchaeota archaeon]